MAFEQRTSTCQELGDDIKNLDLPIRVYNVLTKHNFYKISKLKRATYQQLKSMRFLGDKTIIIIEKKLGIQYDRKMRDTFEFDINANIQIQYIKETINELHQKIHNSYELIAENPSCSDIEFWEQFYQIKASFEVLAIATNIPVPPSDYWSSVEYMSKLKFLKSFRKQQSQHQTKIYKVKVWMDKLFK